MGLCLKNMHNIAIPINPCAEPDWWLARTSRVRSAKTLSSFVSVVMGLCLIVPGERAPGRLGEMPPHPRGQSADRRCADRRTVAALRLGLSLQRKGAADP